MTKNKTKEITNTDNDLIAKEIQKIVKNVADVKKPTQQQTYFMYRFFGLEPKLSAKLAGYKESYAYQLNHRYKHDRATRTHIEEILAEFPNSYRNFCRLQLPGIAEAEKKAVQKYKEDPDLLIKHPQLAKGIKQAAGVDLHEATIAPRVTTFNIKELRMVHADLDTNREAIPVAEIVEDTEIINEDDAD